jgi:hypothetical protein
MRISTDDGFYTITPMPSQPNIALCNDFTVLPWKRKQGRGHVLKEHQVQQLRLLNFTMALCTVQCDNIGQTKILIKSGWDIISSFRDNRTGRRANLWCLILDET